ncbi:hypothetical protein B0T17DRAFT_611870 [Bombardia bombarda]|uniref:Chromatin modification-related protein n=1 Tax=Bombardia bombarda TaxID=252184 RepID=A0AA39XKE4_9PEZI|nr:hypothetical protein B0T17DRAFT_611870 [Bombardia bombarda]
MKTAKPSAPDASSSASRRAQPVRQTRINPPRTSSLNRGNSFPGAPHQEQPIDIFPAVTHFADAITALPKELVRHFTLLKEVDAKIFAPEAALFQLIDAALNTPAPEPTRSVNDASSSVAPASTPMSVQNSTTGSAVNANHTGVPSNSDSVNAAAFDPSNMPRRQLFRQAAWKIQEMLVSLEEKNHVISTANEALGKQMGRIEEIWPHLENEFSEEAKWGSTTHWAYVENRPSKTNHTQAERSRREGAATLSAAAQQLAEEAAARSSDRKQALAAKKNSKTQAAETEPDAKAQDSAKKPPGNSKSRKHPVESPAPPIGLGISTTPASNGTAPSKRRKVDSAKTNGAVPAERAMSTVFGSSAQKPKTTSPRETPVPETTSKKRKALPTSSSQAKKRTNVAAMSPSVATSPMVGTFPENVKIGRSSPVPPPPAPPRPTSSRARQNSTQPNGDITRRPLSAASNKPNGIVPPATPEVVPQSNGAKANTDVKAQKETVPPVASIPRPVKPETETPPPPPDPVPNGNSKKEVVAKTVEEREPKRDSATPAATPMPVTPAIAATAATTATTTTTTTTTTVTTKSGRASKPSTPALATFAEAATARSRPSRNAEAGGNNGAATTPATTATKRSHKKGASSISAAAAAIAIQAAQQQTGHETGAVAGKKDASAGAQQGGDRSSNHVNNESSSNGNNASGNSNSNSNVNNSLNKDDDDDDRDVDEQRYCLCNEISYGEMVACDGDGCAREWFHLDCVGLKVAPKGNAKWYCEDCKKRLQRR